MFNNNEGFQWNSKKCFIKNDYLWNTAVYYAPFEEERGIIIVLLMSVSRSIRPSVCR